MKNETLIKILVAIIIGLIGWSAHREIYRVDSGVKVLHGRVNIVDNIKADDIDMWREFDHVWRETNRMQKEIDDLKK